MEKYNIYLQCKSWQDTRRFEYITIDFGATMGTPICIVDYEKIVAEAADNAAASMLELFEEESEVKYMICNKRDEVKALGTRGKETSYLRTKGLSGAKAVINEKGLLRIEMYEGQLSREE